MDSFYVLGTVLIHLSEDRGFSATIGGWVQSIWLHLGKNASGGLSECEPRIIDWDDESLCGGPVLLRDFCD